MKKSALYANEYHRFQSFQDQLQNNFQNRLENQLTKFLKHATKNIKKALNKQRSYQRYSHAEDADIVTQTRVINQTKNTHGTETTLMPKTVVQTLQMNLAKVKRKFPI